MRKFAIALAVTAAVALAGGVAADAATWSGTLGLPSATKKFSPVEKAACYGPGRWCPPLCAPMRTVEMQMRALLVDKVPAT
jgi:hypothetical protein